MKRSELRRGLRRSPLLAWDILVRGRYSFMYDLMPVRVRRMSARKRLNLLRAGGNLAYRRSHAWGWPLHMQIELTNFCGLQCPVCPTGTGRHGRRPTAMDPRLLARLLDEVGPYLLTSSLWAWGEPLLHPRLSEALGVVAKHKVVTFLSTNGQNLDSDRVLAALVEHPPTYLVIAVDGLSDDTNSRYRAGARLAPILDGVRRLAALRNDRGQRLPILNMRFIAMNHNQHEVPQLSGFAREAGFDMVSVRTLCVIDAEERPHRALVPSSGGLQAYEYSDDRRLARGDHVCQQPFWFPTMLADGTVIGCEQDYSGRLPMGVMNSGTSFRQVWFGPQAAAARRQVRDRRDEQSFCRSCPFEGLQAESSVIHAEYFDPGRLPFRPSGRGE